MIYTVKSPQELEELIYDRNKKTTSIFLAGSINNGAATDWQQEIIDIFKKYHNPEEQFVLINPRREEWNESFGNKKEDTQFANQVKWELRHLKKADVIFMIFDKEGLSPVSLIEFGLFAASNKMLLCCPDEFYRSGNVHITCDEYKVPYTNDYEEFKENIINSLKYDIQNQQKLISDQS